MSDLELKLTLNGQNSCIDFIDENVLLLYSSNGVSFLNIESGEITIFRPTGLRNVDLVCVHPEYHLFAVAEKGLNPKIQVFQYPECKILSTLDGIAKLEYKQIAFSNSVYLTAISGVPDFNLALWHVYTGAKIAETACDVDFNPSLIAFNPGNWHQFCTVSRESGNVSFWNVERTSKYHILRKNDIRLPFISDIPDICRETPISTSENLSENYDKTKDETKIESQSVNKASTHTKKLNEIDVPRSAMAEIVGKFAEEFEIEPFDKTRLKAEHVAFNAKDEIVISCSSGHLLAVTVVAIYDSSITNDQTQSASKFSYTTKCILHPNMKVGEKEESMDSNIWRPKPGDLENIRVHASCVICFNQKSGLIRVIHNVFPYPLLCELNTGADGVLSAQFSVHYEHTVVYTTSRSILLLPNFANSLPNELLSRSSSAKNEQVNDAVTNSKPFPVRALQAVDAVSENSRKSGMHKKPFIAHSHFGDGNVVGVAPVGTETDVAVVLTSGGWIQCWDIAQNLKQLSAAVLPQPSSGTKREWNMLASCPALKLVVAATTSGELCFVDLTTMALPRLIAITRLSRKPIVNMKFDYLSQLLIAITGDNIFFVIDPRPSKSFQVIGYSSLPGEAFPGALSVYSSWEAENKISVAAGYLAVPGKDEKHTKQVQQNKNQFTKIVFYQLDAAKLKQAPSELYIHQIRRELKDSELGQLLFTISTPSTDLTLVDHHRLVTLVADTGRMANFSLSAFISTVVKPEPSSANEVLQPVDYNLDTSFGYSSSLGLNRSPDSKWLMLYGVDGHIAVVNINNPNMSQTSSICPPVDRRLKGIIKSSIVASSDNRYFMAAGGDGSAVIMQFGLTRTSTGRSKRISDSSDALKGWSSEFEESNKSYLEWRSRCRDLASREGRVLESIPLYSPPKRKEKRTEDSSMSQTLKRSQEEPHGPSVYRVKPIELPEDATVVETFTARAIYADDEKMEAVKSQLLSSLVHIRERLHIMMTENAGKPDLEKLDHHEFDLDSAEQTRLLQEGDLAAKNLKKLLEAEVAARYQYIQRIRKECFDSLEVKSKGIRGMTSQLRVNNYPLKPKTGEEIAFLETIRKIRENEITEFKARKSQTLEQPTGTEGETSEGLGATTTMETTDLTIETSDETTATSNRQQFSHQQGSFAVQFGADYSLLYDQFGLQTRDQKLFQIVLLKNAIYSIKQVFNKEFEEACQRKENEMSKIYEKNRRLRQIQELLEIFDKKSVTGLIEYEPNPASSEDTEQLFSVEDSVVPAEKYISPAERKRREEAEKADLERLIRERGDNPRERGLMDMMGGVLEVKKEDELRKGVPVPSFMTEGKPEAEWNEEEIKVAADYHRKNKELTEEREKYRKVIDAESKKLRQQVAESVAAYEETLSELFKRKFKTEMAIYQEELKISRIQLELVVESCLSAQLNELRRKIEDNRSKLLASQKDVSDAREWLGKSQESYDILLAEDKVLEKGFRREFSDAGAQGIDNLIRLFKRRPKGLKTGVQLIQAIASAAGSGNPFAERPSTATQEQQADAQLETALIELDKEANAPEGLDPSIWRRFCNYRRQKIEKEFKIKEQAIAQAESQAFLTHRMQDQEMIRQDIEKLSNEVTRLENEYERFILNLQVQLIVKQGQVEVKQSHPDCHLIPNFDDAILVHRNVVEQLNDNILRKGAAKISNMERAKKTKRDIVRLEWEHQRLNMEMTDLDQRLHDIDHLKVTRQVQLFLKSADYDSKLHEEMAALEKTLVAQQQYHAKSMERLKEISAELEGTVVRDTRRDTQIDSELDHLNVQVCEQRHMVEVVSGELEIDAARRRRYASVVNRSRLVEVARAQASEIAVLRQEVERLRLKTFPALVQLD